MTTYHVRALTTLAALGMLGAPCAAKTVKQAASDSCHDAVTHDVRARYRQSDRIEYLGDQLAEGAHATGVVQGHGRFRDNAGDWVPFSYQCTYNLGSGKTYAVDFHADKQAASRADEDHGDDLWRDGAHGSTRGAITACEQAARKRIEQKHAHARDVRFNRPDTAEPSRGEVGINGGGDFRASNGDRFSFSYECTYNSANGKVHAVRVTGM